MKVKIEVTQDDIDKGKGGAPDRCPVARGVARRAAKQSSLKVGWETCGIEFGDGYHVAYLPKFVGEFIKAFDRAEPVKPFTFTLDIPKEHLR